MKRQAFTACIILCCFAVGFFSVSHFLPRRVPPLQIDPATLHYDLPKTTPQFVIFSFDGSKSVDMLNETLAFQRKMFQEAKPIHFTYFINAAYFLTKETALLYKNPLGKRGVSNIGFSDSANDIALRVKGLNTAFVDGNEIGSHSVGHFNGSLWTYEQWKEEFDSFTSLMANVQKNNPSVAIDEPTFLGSIKGFRAPDLGKNKNVYKVLAESHFTYDASEVSNYDVWPYKDSGGIWHIPFAVVYLGENLSPVVSMDYNVWMRQSQGRNTAVAGTPLWNNYLEETETAYMNVFNKHYNGNRSPIVIGDHFSKLNDGVYFEAMKNFAENVCGRPDVQCTTFASLVEYLNTNGAPKMKV